MTNNFKFYVFDPRDTQPFAQDIISKTYEMWRNVWLQALGELDGATDMKSDDFTRQQKVGALFQDGIAVGSVFFQTVDLAQPMWRKDSYFSAWPEERMVDLGSRYSAIEVCSYFTLSQAYRRGVNGFNGKQLLAALGYEHWYRMSVPAMVGTMRVNRGMHTLCYDLHAEPHLTGVQMHGVEVDLVLFDRNRIGDKQGPMALEAREIYSESLSEWNQAMSGLKVAV